MSWKFFIWEFLRFSSFGEENLGLGCSGFFFFFSFQLKFNENWGTFCLHDNTLSFKDAHSYVKLYLKFVIITVLFFPYTTLHSVLTSLMTTNALS